MRIDQIDAGKNVPEDVNVIIEIPANSSSIKYELDKDHGLLTVDRFMPTSMYYPCNYGFIPSTLAEDGDPVDALVISPLPVQPGCLMRCRAIGMLNMTDEAGKDSKIMMLPIPKICAQYEHLNTLADLSPVLLDSIVHFFEHYKRLEKGKWVKVEGWENIDAANHEILSSVKRFNEHYQKV